MHPFHFCGEFSNEITLTSFRSSALHYVMLLNIVLTLFEVIGLVKKLPPHSSVGFLLKILYVIAPWPKNLLAFNINIFDILGAKLWVIASARQFENHSCLVKPLTNIGFYNCCSLKRYNQILVSKHQLIILPTQEKWCRISLTMTSIWKIMTSWQIFSKSVTCLKHKTFKFYWYQRHFY